MATSPIRFEKSGMIVLITLKPYQRKYSLKVNDGKEFTFNFPKHEEDYFYNLCVFLSQGSQVTLLPL
jgi:hypothetical protein